MEIHICALPNDHDPFASSLHDAALPPSADLLQSSNKILCENDVTVAVSVEGQAAEICTARLRYVMYVLVHEGQTGSPLPSFIKLAHHMHAKLSGLGSHFLRFSKQPRLHAEGFQPLI